MFDVLAVCGGEMTMFVIKRLLVPSLVVMFFAGCPPRAEGQPGPRYGSKYGSKQGAQRGENDLIELPSSSAPPLSQGAQISGTRQEGGPSQDLEDGRDRRQKAFGEAGAVGVLLPLTGRGQQVGAQALMGLQLAVADMQGSQVLPRFVVRDTRSDPKTAEAEARRLAAERQVLAFLGPPGAVTSRAVGEVSRQHRIPFLTLAPGGALSSMGGDVFRLCVTAAGELAMLSDFARKRGFSNYGILHPENRFGHALAKLVSSIAQGQGGRVVVTTSYKAGATSFRTEMEALRSSRIEVLFVLDTARAVSLIAPALAASGVARSPSGEGGVAGPLLLLPSIAFDEKVLASASRYLEGAVASAPVHGDTSSSTARIFFEKFLDRFGREPDLFSASTYDGAMFVSRWAALQGGEVALSLSEYLRRQRDVDTAGPGRGFRPGGEPFRATRLVSMRNSVWQSMEVSVQR